MVVLEERAEQDKNQSLTEEQQLAILQYAQEQCSLKATGAGSTNRSAVKDVNFTSTQIQSEVCPH